MRRLLVISSFCLGLFGSFGAQASNSSHPCSGEVFYRHSNQPVAVEFKEGPYHKQEDIGFVASYIAHVGEYTFTVDLTTEGKTQSAVILPSGAVFWSYTQASDEPQERIAFKFPPNDERSVFSGLCTF